MGNGWEMVATFAFPTESVLTCDFLAQYANEEQAKAIQKQAYEEGIEDDESEGDDSVAIVWPGM